MSSNNKTSKIAMAAAFGALGAVGAYALYKNVSNKSKDTSKNNEKPEIKSVIPTPEVKKEVIVEEEKKEEVIEEKKVEPVVEEKKVEPLVEEKKEEPVVEEKKVEPVVEKKEEPLVEEKKEEPVVEEKKEPVVENKKEEAIVEEKKEEPVVEEVKSMSSPQTPEPVQSPITTTSPSSEQQEIKPKESSKAIKQEQDEIEMLTKLIENPSVSPDEVKQIAATVIKPAETKDTSVKKNKKKPVSKPIVEQPKLKKTAFIPGMNEEKKPEEKKPVEKKPLDKNTISARNIYSAASKLYSKKDYKAALSKFEEALNICPEDQSNDRKTILFSMSKVYNKLKLIPKAIDCLTQAISVDETYSNAYLSRAECYEAQGEDEKALEDYTYSYLLDTFAQVKNAEMPQGMATILNKMAVQKAKEEIQRRKTDENTPYFMPSDAFITFYLSTLQSEKYDVINKEKLSVEELTNQITESPANGDLYAKRGEAYKNEHNYKKSLADYEKALELGVTDNHGYLCLDIGTYYHLEGKYEEAYKYYMMNKEECGESVNLYVKLGGYYYEVDNVEKATSCFDRAVELGKKIPDGYFHRGQMFVLQDKTSKAVTDFNKVKSLSPNFIPVYMQLATVALKYFDQEKAHAFINQAISLDPKNAQTLNQFGEICVLEGDSVSAETLFNRAIEIQPEWPYPYVNLSALHLQSAGGDLKQSIELLLTAIKEDDNCIQAYCQISSLYLMNQQMDKSVEYINKAIEIAHTERDLTEIYVIKLTADTQMKAFETLSQKIAI
ncbi:hypothetical protein WA158_002486 [Blastocystis sp. Blastoise]